MGAGGGKEWPRRRNKRVLRSRRNESGRGGTDRRPRTRLSGQRRTFSVRMGSLSGRFLRFLGRLGCGAPPADLSGQARGDAHHSGKEPRHHAGLCAHFIWPLVWAQPSGWAKRPADPGGRGGTARQEGGDRGRRGAAERVGKDREGRLQGRKPSAAVSSACLPGLGAWGPARGSEALAAHGTGQAWYGVESRGHAPGLSLSRSRK